VNRHSSVGTILTPFVVHIGIELDLPRLFGRSRGTYRMVVTCQNALGGKGKEERKKKEQVWQMY